MTHSDVPLWESAGDVYEEAFRSLGTPALLTDRNFIIRDVNEDGLAFVGYDREELVGRPVSVVSSEETITNDVKDRLLSGEKWHGEFEVVTASGETIRDRGAASPIIVDGTVRGYVALFIDTSRQRRYEQTTQVLNRVLRHDIRNDLNVVYGHVQNLESTLEPDQSTQKIDEIKATLTALIEKSARARKLQKWLERTHESDNRPVSLEDALHDALVDAIEEYDHATFEFDEFPSVTVRGDEMLPTVFEILFENAVVHNDAETPVVSVDVTVQADTVVVRVRDNGPGIEKDREDLIFGREERDQLHHGQGIGLFFADTVVRGYDGDIWLESSDDGSTFSIQLERSQPD